MKKIIKIFALLIFIISLWNCSNDDKNQSEWQAASLENIKGCIVNSIVIDKYGNKWFGTSKGLAGFTDEDWYVFTRSEEMVKNKINWLYVNDDMNTIELWLATDYGVSVLLLNEQLEIDVSYNYTTKNVDLISDSVNRIVAGKDNDIWFLTDKGISLFDSIWYEKSGNRKIDVIPFLSALFPSKGSNYCGRQRNGMIKFDYSHIDGITGASEWVSPYNGIILDTVNYIFKSTSEELWFACYGNPELVLSSLPKDGLLKHVGDDPKSGFTLYNSTLSGLANNRINYIDESSDGKIWLATEGGISFQVNDTLFGNYSTSDGLINNYVICLAFDLDGSLWCGTLNGVSHLKDKVFTNYLTE